jgi:hypothetical protein
VTEQHPEGPRSMNEAPHDLAGDVIYFCCDVSVRMLFMARMISSSTPTDGLLRAPVEQITR